jgi:catechol 2,3-dioxygenase-like lactoylglutathione lyase family enzyme
VVPLLAYLATAPALQEPPEGSIHQASNNHSPGHAPNDNRIAFKVESAAEVDRAADVARQAAADLSGPRPMPYGPGYYAAYFADPSGNRLEVDVRPE